jgi:hypothetical protein
MVRISNINTLRQQTINAVTLQENALKFFMGLPVDTRISIPETEFEITPNALSLAPDTTTRTEYLLLKRTRAVTGIKNLLKRTTTQVYHLQEDITSLVKVLRCLGSRNHLMEFIGLTASPGLNLRIPIFDLEQKSKVKLITNFYKSRLRGD